MEENPLSRYLTGFVIATAAPIVSLIVYFINPFGVLHNIILIWTGAGIGIMIRSLRQISKRSSDISLLRKPSNYGSYNAPAIRGPIRPSGPTISSTFKLGLLISVPVILLIAVTAIVLSHSIIDYASGDSISLGLVTRRFL